MAARGVCFFFAVFFLALSSDGMSFQRLDLLRKSVREESKKEEVKKEEEPRRRRPSFFQPSIGLCHHGHFLGHCDLCSSVRRSTQNAALAASLSHQYGQHSAIDHVGSASNEVYPELNPEEYRSLDGTTMDGEFIPNRSWDRDWNRVAYFPSYPYQDGRGYLVFSEEEWRALESWKPWGVVGVRASGEYGTSFDGLQSINSEFLLESRWRLGVEADQRWQAERRVTGGYDDLWIGDTNLFVRLGQSKGAEFRIGGGFHYLSDRIGSDFGPNATAAVDWYAIDPVVFSLEGDLGKLGETDLTHVRGTCGMAIRHAEPYVGFDYLRIGEFSTTSLISGIRLWF